MDVVAYARVSGFLGTTKAGAGGSFYLGIWGQTEQNSKTDFLRRLVEGRGDRKGGERESLDTDSSFQSAGKQKFLSLEMKSIRPFTSFWPESSHMAHLGTGKLGKVCPFGKQKCLRQI